MSAKDPNQRAAEPPEESEKGVPAVGYQSGVHHSSPTPDGAEASARKREAEQQAAHTRLKGSHPGDRYVRVARQAPPLPVEAPKPKPRAKLKRRQTSSFQRCLLQGEVREVDAPYEPEEQVQHAQSWWRVMCLTGVDYFSTLGYQPGIAALAAGFLSPIATLILVLLTLFGALPIYRYIASESPHGEGSIAMLERLLPWWQGKLFVLALLGFVATDFVITITLSAADATAHVVENPFTNFMHRYEIPVTLFLIALLGAVFLKGFGEAIGIAVGLVSVYLLLNIIVIGVSLAHVIQNPSVIGRWQEGLFRQHSNPLAMVGIALLLFPASRSACPASRPVWR